MDDCTLTLFPDVAQETYTYAFPQRKSYIMYYIMLLYPTEISE